MIHPSNEPSIHPAYHMTLVALGVIPRVFASMLKCGKRSENTCMKAAELRSAKISSPGVRIWWCHGLVCSENGDLITWNPPRESFNHPCEVLAWNSLRSSLLPIRHRNPRTPPTRCWPEVWYCSSISYTLLLAVPPPSTRRHEYDSMSLSRRIKTHCQALRPSNKKDSSIISGTRLYLNRSYASVWWNTTMKEDAMVAYGSQAPELTPWHVDIRLTIVT